MAVYQAIPNQPGVYLITNTVTAKVYVGSATRMRTRIQKHRTELVSGKHGNALLQRAWNKYGAAAFQASVIRACGVDELRVIEQAEIDARAAAERKHGYNLNPKASPGRWLPHSEATKRRIGEANKGKGGTGRRGIPRPAHVVEIVAQRYRGVGPPGHVMEAARAANRGNQYHHGHQHDAAARARMSEKTRGERHPRAVLTNETVRDVRRLRAEGMSGPAIARIYGVNNSSIYDVINGTSWRHIEEETP